MTKIVVPKAGKKLPLFIEEKEVKALIENMEKSLPVEFEGLRDYLVIKLLYISGMRRAELIAVRDSDIRFDQGIIKIMGKGGKERLIPIDEKTSASLSVYQNLKGELFPDSQSLILTSKGKQAYPNLIYRIVNQALNGYTTLSRKSPHVMRHTFATQLANNGAELNAVKELLGHASLASTQVYTHTSIDRLKDIYKKAHPKG